MSIFSEKGICILVVIVVLFENVCVYGIYLAGEWRF